MKNFILLLISILLIRCNTKEQDRTETEKINLLSENYIKTGLKAGLYDPDFVDAYYGPDSLKPDTSKLSVFPKDSLLKECENLTISLKKIISTTKNDSLRVRAVWLSHQLTAFKRRIKIFSGETASFDQESKELFDAVAPSYSEQHFKSLLSQLDNTLPAGKTIPDRFQKLAGHFLIPKEKIDTVFKTAIAEARKRTLLHYDLPKEESFRMEYVTDKPWSGYNWYQGKYKSIIQINISQPIFIERAIDLACHEGYPGHHVYNVLLEKNLYHDKGYTEIALYPLFSPQSLIAEGSANYGISVAFPGDQQKLFCRQVLLPIAGIDTTGTDKYFKALQLKSQLNYARNEVARGLINGTMKDQEAIRWLSDYCLLTSKGATDYLRFIKKYRSYVINYNYGQDLVKNYIEWQGGTNDKPGKRWQLFKELLSKEMTASDLIKK
ncbi:hypothetical protein [Dyadobacter sp. NIV53]|uniref:hypothetical protein n=1 Tax=Dyadobacter sp. NIV53 TaxID=2861765 RepID=UPI001E584E10|nr:hypothetical protein [Dyadobacter sp. NIV53]